MSEEIAMPPIGSLDTDVLIVIDAQNDFCPGGALAVPGGDEIMPLINTLAQRFKHLVLTQDWHLRDQISFASRHGLAPFSVTEVAYGQQVLWPDHCVQGTPGAEMHPLIAAGAQVKAELIVRKGYNPAVDSYSAFFENDKITSTGLAGYLAERGFRRCVFVGLAFDFCVRYSAEDAVAQGFEAVVVVDATRAIDMDGSRAAAFAALDAAGVELIDSGGSSAAR
jgi:nicotinamidase/pyrazinamidase